MKKMPADVIEMYSKFYREFQESDFDLDTDKKLFDWSQTYIALGNMMTSAALVGIDSCPIEGFHQEKAELYYERSSTWIQRNTVCPSWSHLDTEKQIQQTLSQEEK
jgi:hypothetical protein